MQRTPLPCPPPQALMRAWRGDRGRGAEERGEEGGEEGGEQAALGEWSRALAGGVVAAAGGRCGGWGGVRASGGSAGARPTVVLAVEPHVSRRGTWTAAQG